MEVEQAVREWVSRYNAAHQARQTPAERHVKHLGEPTKAAREWAKSRGGAYAE